jgi:hypothetical protein
MVEWLMMLDTYQRYLEIFELVNREIKNTTNKTFKLLDVGSNGPGYASYNQYDRVIQTNIDITDAGQGVKERYPRVKFMRYSGEQLPYNEGSFDFVCCVGVLEHIPPERRKEFILDTIRVGRKFIIFEFPIKTSEPWEKMLSVVTFKKIKFLQEHIEYGLPGEKDIHIAIKNNDKVRVVREKGDINIWLWIPVKLLSSIIYAIIKNHNNLIYTGFRIYQNTLAKIINGGQCHSRVFVLEKRA